MKRLVDVIKAALVALISKAVTVNVNIVTVVINVTGLNVSLPLKCLRCKNFFLHSEKILELKGIIKAAPNRRPD